MSPTPVPPSLEVTLYARLRGNDPDLVREVADARRRLDQLAPMAVALLNEIRALEERAFDVVDVLDPAWSGAIDRVMEVTGARELMDAAANLVRAYPVE